MYKLTVIAGPQTGSSFALQDGVVSIGRLPSNVIVLPSSKVSKTHCRLVVGGESVMLEDQGSANGTFVNGVKSGKRELKSGDKISVGEYVLELHRPKMRSVGQAPAANVIAFPGGAARLPSGPPASASDGASAGMAGLAGLDPVTAPRGLLEKAKHAVETFVMPIFYGQMVRVEWRSLAMAILGVFLFLNLAISVYPMIEGNKMTVRRESLKRAQAMAVSIADANSAALAAGAETRTTIGTVDREPGVRAALLMDLKSRIIAPAGRANQMFTTGPEATFAAKLSKLYESGKTESTEMRIVGDDIAVVVEPVKVVDPRLGRNVVVALALVSIDADSAMLGSGAVGLIYSKVLILTGLLGMVAFYILYRVTLKPFEILNIDMDRALKGEIGRLKQDFKFEEVASLWDLFNSAIQRIPKEGLAASADVSQAISFNAREEVGGAFKMFGEMAPFGLVVCDDQRRIVSINPKFEDMSGIHSHHAEGQEISAVARDQALIALCNDIFDRVLPGGDPVVEDFEFGGVNYKVHGQALGSGGSPKGFVLAFQKQDAASGSFRR